MNQFLRLTGGTKKFALRQDDFLCVCATVYAQLIERVARRRGGKLLLVGQIQAQPSDRHISLLDSPAIGTGLSLFHWNDAEPVMLASPWVFSRNYLAVVMTHRLPRPTQPLRLDVGKI